VSEASPMIPTVQYSSTTIISRFAIIHSETRSPPDSGRIHPSPGNSLPLPDLKGEKPPRGET